MKINVRGKKYRVSLTDKGMVFVICLIGIIVLMLTKETLTDTLNNSSAWGMGMVMFIGGLLVSLFANTEEE